MFSYDRSNKTHGTMRDNGMVGQARTPSTTKARLFNPFVERIKLEARLPSLFV